MRMSPYRNIICDTQASVKIGINSSIKTNTFYDRNTIIQEEKCIARKKKRLPEYPILHILISHNTEGGCLVCVYILQTYFYIYL